ncbi:hypothetical protein C8J56DRAFT_1091718, partial [Mycena floridula]
GASNFLGSHIVLQLLKTGYRVRATSSPEAADGLRSRYTKFRDLFEVMAIADVTSQEFPKAFEGVHAVIHTSWPLPTEKSFPDVINKAGLDGLMNVVRQAEEAGVQRVIVKANVASVINQYGSFTDRDWNPVVEGAKGRCRYETARILAEKALWDYSESHPELDITTINTPTMYGPFASHGFTLSVSPNDPKKIPFYALSTNFYLYNLFMMNGEAPSDPYYLDVRDAAEAFVLALKSPLSTEPGIGRKRLIMSSPHEFDYSMVKELRATTVTLDPEPTSSSTSPVARAAMPVDFTRLGKVLGRNKDDLFRPVGATMLDTFDSLRRFEDAWKAKGLEIASPERSKHD